MNKEVYEKRKYGILLGKHQGIYLPKGIIG